MQFNNYARKEVSYEEKMKIAENKTKVEATLECIRTHLPNALIHNVETDSLCKQVASIVDLSDKGGYLVDLDRGPQSGLQEQIMNNLEHISFNARSEIKMNFVVDMKRKKYLSTCKDEDIGSCILFLYPINATKPIILLAEENQSLKLYAYVGKPETVGLAFISVEDEMDTYYIQLHEFHFLSLRKDPKYNYEHGLLLSYNPEWGWKNISFGIILKENQDMVRELFDSVRNQIKPMTQPDSNTTNMKMENNPFPQQ